MPRNARTKPGISESSSYIYLPIYKWSGYVNLVRAAALAALVGIVSTPALAQRGQANSEVCAALAQSIDTFARDSAAADADEFLDDSAPRATNRLLRQLIAATNTQTTIKMMEGQRCALPAEPLELRQAGYMGNALECVMSRKLGEKDAVKTKCDRSTWIAKKATTPLSFSR